MHPLVTVTNINPDEIPDVPPNRFLYRSDRQTSAHNRSKMDRGPREHEQRRRSRIRGITKSGRVIKGRGVFVSMTQCGIMLLDLFLFKLYCTVLLYWSLLFFFSLKVKIFWVVMLCSVAVGYQCFRGSCCPHLGWISDH
jgi:hypothetical protein